MKAFAKQLLRFAALIVVSPALLSYHLHRAIAGPRAFTGWSQLMSLIPGTSGVYLRHAFYRRTLSRCDSDAYVGFGTILSDPAASIGQTAYIGNYCSIGNADIGKDVLIASHVSIMNGTNQHRIERLDLPVREQLGEFPKIAIGEDSWIGERATIAANVGRHCVVGAGSVLLTDLPDYAIAVGCPAKVIRDRRELAVNAPVKDDPRTMLSSAVTNE